MTFEAKRSELLTQLQTAAELEMATIPAYLTALLSIKRPGNRGAAENIRSVMTEEMLHLALVSNVISSVGGALQLTKNHVPVYPLRMTFKGKAFDDRMFDVHLAQFSKATIETFMAIEQPRAFQMQTAAFELDHITVPQYTIGEFYDGILNLLAELDGLVGHNLFVGDPQVQISEDYYWSAGGKPVVVTDLSTARSALSIVIRQGEGARDSLGDGDNPRFGQPFEVAHYFRFREIYCGRRYVASDLPSGDPSGDLLEVDYSSVFPIKADAKSADYVGTDLAPLNDAFNRQYTRMLAQLQEALNGNPKVLYNAIMNGMHGLSDLGIQLMSRPVAGDPQGRHGCPTFEWLDS